MASILPVLTIFLRGAQHVWTGCIRTRPDGGSGRQPRSPTASMGGVQPSPRPHPLPPLGPPLASRHPSGHRTVHELGDVSTGRPVHLVVLSSSHDCSKGRQHGHRDLRALAPPGGPDPQRVRPLAVRLVVEDGLPYRPASWHLWRDHRVFVPFATIQNWTEAGGKKGTRSDGQYVSGLGA